MQEHSNHENQIDQSHQSNNKANSNAQFKRIETSDGVDPSQLQEIADQYVESKSPLQKKEKPNSTGLPDQLKSGIEHLSGYSMDDVKVHYNSKKPAQLQAHAYAQGNEIHLAPGQERHLPHEAWHVVQQKQNRVKPTKTVNGESINDNPSLEKEADTMGAKANKVSQMVSSDSSQHSSNKDTTLQMKPVIQRAYYYWSEKTGKFEHSMLPASLTPGIEPYVDANGEAVLGPDNKPAWISIIDRQIIRGRDAAAAIEDRVQEGLGLAQVQAEAILGQGIINQARDLADDAPLLQDFNQRNYGAVVERFQANALSLATAVSIFMKQNVLKIIAGMFVGAGLVTLGFWLSTLTLFAPWLGIASTALTTLYSVYLIWRWTQNELLPVFVRAPLVAVNVGITMFTLGKVLFDVIMGNAFQHMVFAAIPFALVLEHIFSKIIERINAIRAGGGNAEEDLEAPLDQEQGDDRV